MRTEEVHSSPRKGSRLGSHRVVLSPQATPVPASASKLNVDITITQITQKRNNATTQQSFGPEPGTKQSLIRISSTRNDDFPQHGGASLVCCSFWPLPLCGAPEIQSPAWTTNVAIARILGSGENRRCSPDMAPRSSPGSAQGACRFGASRIFALEMTSFPSSLQFLPRKSRLGSIVAHAMRLAVIAFGDMCHGLLQHPIRLKRYSWALGLAR
jgi:hypothetical protein